MLNNSVSFLLSFSRMSSFRRQTGICQRTQIIGTLLKTTARNLKLLNLVFNQKRFRIVFICLFNMKLLEKSFFYLKRQIILFFFSGKKSTKTSKCLENSANAIPSLIKIELRLLFLGDTPHAVMMTRCSGLPSGNVWTCSIFCTVS